MLKVPPPVSKVPVNPLTPDVLNEPSYPPPESGDTMVNVTVADRSVTSVTASEPICGFEQPRRWAVPPAVATTAAAPAPTIATPSAKIPTAPLLHTMRRPATGRDGSPRP